MLLEEDGWETSKCEVAHKNENNSKVQFYGRTQCPRNVCSSHNPHWANVEEAGKETGEETSPPVIRIRRINC